jgi:L-threonylcarbamoyladenylate synthase
LLERFSELGRGAPAGIAAPSANRFGRVSPTSAHHVRDEFPPGSADPVHVLDGGSCRLGIESTIVDLSRVDRVGPVLLRPGSVSVEMLAEILGAAPRQADAAAPKASGTLASHYAPRTPLRLVDAAALRTLSDNRAASTSTAVWAYSVDPPAGNPKWLRAPADPGRYAHQLYATLRRLDALGADEIWIEAPPRDLPEWAGVTDRLSRAATCFDNCQGRK